MNANVRAARGEAGDICVAYVLDRTGSMAAIRKETVSGFRDLVREQAGQEGETAVTPIASDHHLGPQTEIPFLGAPAREVVAEAGIPPGIVPRGTTPLYDAIAAAIPHTQDWLAARPDPWTGKVLPARCYRQGAGRRQHRRPVERERRAHP